MGFPWERQNKVNILGLPGWNNSGRLWGIEAVPDCPSLPLPRLAKFLFPELISNLHGAHLSYASKLFPLTLTHQANGSPALNLPRPRYQTVSLWSVRPSKIPKHHNRQKIKNMINTGIILFFKAW